MERIRSQIYQVHAKLLACYGQPPANKRKLLLDILIQTILSQNTSDVNSLRAYKALKLKYPDWKQAALATPQQLAKTIRSGGLANIKSRRIVALLRNLVKQVGRPDLEHLREMDPEAAYVFLKSIKGVGPKTAACTLLFGAGLPIFPVDTHIYRVSQRLGWVKNGEDRERFQERFRHLVPEALVYPLHLNLIEHGRNWCHPRKPLCQDCCLKHICQYGKEII